MDYNIYIYIYVCIDGRQMSNPAWHHYSLSLNLSVLWACMFIRALPEGIRKCCIIIMYNFLNWKKKRKEKNWLVPAWITKVAQSTTKPSRGAGDWSRCIHAESIFTRSSYCQIPPRCSRSSRLKSRWILCEGYFKQCEMWRRVPPQTSQTYKKRLHRGL